ncbi:MAG TPA: hypothetical protein VJU61_23875 [Polyangiaceae bacterium]|nr:hypothetical protein [Polyangiaceae bacterium]
MGLLGACAGASADDAADDREFLQDEQQADVRDVFETVEGPGRDNTGPRSGGGASRTDFCRSVHASCRQRCVINPQPGVSAEVRAALAAYAASCREGCSQTFELCMNPQ